MSRSGGQARKNVERVYGLSAALAVLARRPADVLRIAYTPAARKPLAAALREAARRRIAYRELDDDALAEMAGAAHHEGVCLLVQPRPVPDVAALAGATVPRGLLVALDGVDNPHNVGAVLRSAAFFGAAGLLVADPTRASLTPAAVRVAEGGAEHVGVLHVKALGPALHELRALGLGVIGTDSHGGVSLPTLRWPDRTVLVLGAEQHGLSEQARSACSVVACISGTGVVESLNVAVAAGVMLASYAGARG